MPAARTIPVAIPAADDGDVATMLRDVLKRLGRIEAALTERRHTPKSPGRKAVDDADALDEFDRMVCQGVEPWAAIKSVALALGGQVEAHQQRLRRKVRQRSAAVRD